MLVCHGLGLGLGGGRGRDREDELGVGEGDDAYAEAVLPGAQDRAEPRHVVLVVQRAGPADRRRDVRAAAGGDQGDTEVPQPGGTFHQSVGGVGGVGVGIGGRVLSLDEGFGEARPVGVLGKGVIVPELGQDLVGVVITGVGHLARPQPPLLRPAPAVPDVQQHREETGRTAGGLDGCPGALRRRLVRAPQQRFVPRTVVRGVDQPPLRKREFKPEHTPARVGRQLGQRIGKGRHASDCRGRHRQRPGRSCLSTTGRAAVVRSPWGGQSLSGVLMPSRAMPRCRVRAVRSTRNSRFSTCAGDSAFRTGHWS